MFPIEICVLCLRTYFYVKILSLNSAQFGSLLILKNINCIKIYISTLITVKSTKQTFIEKLQKSFFSKIIEIMRKIYNVVSNLLGLLHLILYLTISNLIVFQYEFKLWLSLLIITSLFIIIVFCLLFSKKHIINN